MSFEQIIHISDIHIAKSTKRHIEYKKVFHNLFVSVDGKIKGKKSLIVVCGDILHNKDALSSEQIMLARQFLEQLSKRCQTIIIAGNHDMNMSNHQRLDSLTPIVNGLNVAYLSKSGIYEFENVVVVVNSLLNSYYDEESDDIIHDMSLQEFIRFEDLDLSCNEKKVVVCLYHGMINGSKNFNGKEFESNVKLSDFKGYDYVMLGDIHMHQYLKENIAYSGSLIQQNYGESIDGHGYILWNIKDRSSLFVQVKNDYAFMKVFEADVLNDNELMKKIHGIKHIRLNFVYDGKIEYDEYLGKVDMLKSKIKKSHIEILEDYICDNRTYSQVDLRENIINMNDVEHQNELMCMYLKEKNKFEEDVFDKLKQMNYKIYDECHTDVCHLYLQEWRLEKLKFKNVFCYEESVKRDGFHEINFESKVGLIGILGRNYSGKSSIIDIILFALFDKCHRGKKADIIHKKKKNFEIQLTFWIGNVRYQIKKKGVRKNESVAPKVTTEFLQLTHTDSQNLSGSQRSDTNQIIKQTICDYDDFIYTSILLQNDFYGWIKLGNTERIKYFNKILKLEDFEKQYDVVRTKKKDLEKTLDVYRKQMAKLEVASLNLQEENVDQLETMTKDTENMEREKNVLEYEMRNLQIHKKYNSVRECEKNIEMIKNKLCKFDLNQISSISDYDEMNVYFNEMYKKFMDKKTENLQHILKKKQDAIYSKKNVNMDIINKFMSCTEQEQNEKYQQEIKLKQEYEESVEFLKTCDKIISEYEDKIHVIEENKLKYDQLVFSKEQITQKLKKWNVEYDPHCTYCRKNNNVDEKEKLESELKNISSEINVNVNVIHQDNPTDLKKELNILKQKKMKSKYVIEEWLFLEQTQQNQKQLFHIYENELSKNKWNEKIDALIKKIDGEYKKINQSTFKEYETWKTNMEEKKKYDELKNELCLLEKNVEYFEKESMFHVLEKQISQNKSILQRLSKQKYEMETYQTQKDKLNKEIQDLHSDIKIYDTYMEIFGKTGLPLKLMNDTIPAIQNTLNFLTKSIGLDFHYKFHIDDKMNIDLFVVRNSDQSEIDIEMGSGYEKLITSLLMRISIKQIHFLKPNFLFIDEGLSNIDEENFQNIAVVFSLLKEYYKSVFIITHQTEIKNYLDMSIEIQRNQIN